MDKSTHQVRLVQWTQIIEECNHRPEGMTAKQWLEDNNISEKSYYYWQRKIRKEILNKSINNAPAVTAKSEITFAEVPNPCSSNHSDYHYNSVLSDGFNADAIIKCGNSVIALSNSISDAMLSKILEVAAHAR